MINSPQVTDRTLLSVFRLNSTLRAEAEAVLGLHQELGGGCVIGVHVRRTDYKKLLGNTDRNIGSSHMLHALLQVGSILTILSSIVQRCHF